MRSLLNAYTCHWQGIYSASFAYLKHPKFSQSRTLGKKTFGCYREKLLPRLISHIFPPHSFPPMPPQPSVYQRPYIFRTPVFQFSSPRILLPPPLQCLPMHTAQPPLSPIRPIPPKSLRNLQKHTHFGRLPVRKIWPWEEIISATHHSILKVSSRFQLLKASHLSR